MSIDISQKPEQNVINVGDEISGDQLAALQSANNPTAGNPYATMNDVGGGGGGLTAPSDPFTPWLAVWNTNTQTWGNTQEIGQAQFFFDQAGSYQARAEVWGPSSLPSITVTDSGYATYTEVNSSGIKFPDGSLQTTASGSGSGSTYNIVIDDTGVWINYDHIIEANTYAVAYQGGNISFDNIIKGQSAIFANHWSSTNPIYVGTSVTNGIIDWFGVTAGDAGFQGPPNSVWKVIRVKSTVDGDGADLWHVIPITQPIPTV